MGMKDLRSKAVSFIKKYRFVALILLIGLGLMMIPTQKNEPKTVAPAEQQLTEEASVSEALAEILSQVDGAGTVKVLLTIESGEEVLYQTDEETSIDSESNSTQVHTVTLTDSDKSEYGLIRQTMPPVYKGAVVVCQGADDPAIQLAIVTAVARATGLGADRISVLKMK